MHQTRPVAASVAAAVAICSLGLPGQHAFVLKTNPAAAAAGAGASGGRMIPRGTDNTNNNKPSSTAARSRPPHPAATAPATAGENAPVNAIPSAVVQDAPTFMYRKTFWQPSQERTPTAATAATAAAGTTATTSAPAASAVDKSSRSGPSSIAAPSFSYRQTFWQPFAAEKTSETQQQQQQQSTTTDTKTTTESVASSSATSTAAPTTPSTSSAAAASTPTSTTTTTNKKEEEKQTATVPEPEKQEPRPPAAAAAAVATAVPAAASAASPTAAVQKPSSSSSSSPSEAKATDTPVTVTKNSSTAAAAVPESSAAPAAPAAAGAAVAAEGAKVPEPEAGAAKNKSVASSSPAERAPFEPSPTLISDSPVYQEVAITIQKAKEFLAPFGKKVQDNVAEGNVGERGEEFVVAQFLILLFVAMGTVPVIGGLALFLAGPGLFAGGIGLCAAGVKGLSKSLSPWPAPVEDNVLATDGAYGLVRHPMYTGLVMVCLGSGVLTDSPTRMLLSFALAVVLDKKAEKEESMLVGLHGKAYEDYCDAVAKFVPRIY